MDAKSWKSFWKFDALWKPCIDLWIDSFEWIYSGQGHLFEIVKDWSIIQITFIYCEDWCQGIESLLKLQYRSMIWPVHSSRMVFKNTSHTLQLSVVVHFACSPHTPQPHPHVLLTHTHTHPHPQSTQPLYPTSI